MVTVARALSLAAVLVAGASSLMTWPRVGRDRGASEALDDVLARRRSVRSYGPRALTSDELSRLLWAAQGITDPSTGGRTAPSAGALHPLEIYAVTPQGTFRYVPESRELVRVFAGDRRGALARAALGQDAVRLAPVALVLAGVPERSSPKYGARAERYVLLEAGHVAQNVLLEAVALGLGAVPIGAFDDDDVARVVGLRAGEKPLYIVPVGALASR